MKLQRKDGSPTSYGLACGYQHVAVDHMGGHFVLTRYPAMQVYRLTGTDWTGAKVEENHSTLNAARKRLSSLLA